MSGSSIILIGAIFYVGILISVGLYASRNIKTSSDFIVAGRRLPLWLCVFTVFATWFGSGTLIGAAGAAYSKGFLGVVSNPIGSALCLFLAGLFYVRFLRRMRLLTLPDLFRRRFGQWSEVLCGVCIIPAYIGWVASIFVAFSYVLHTVTGIDTTIAVFICATITIIYTFTGGMWAVTLTDFLQALVIIVGLCILFPLVIHDIGGFGSLKMQAPQGHFSLLPKGNFLDWMWFIQALLIIPMTAALYWKKANGPGAVSSIVTGMICWITLETVQSTYPAELIAAGIGLITLILVTLATQNNAPPLPPTDIDGNVLDYSHRLGILSFPSSLKRRSEE